MENFSQKHIVVSKNVEGREIPKHSNIQAWWWGMLLERHGDVLNIPPKAKQFITNEHYRLVSKASRDGLFKNFENFIGFVSEFEDLSYLEKFELIEKQTPFIWEEQEKDLIDKHPEYKGLLGSFINWRANTIYSESLQVLGQCDENNFFELENKKTIWGASPNKKELVKKMIQTSLSSSSDRIEKQNEVNRKNDTKWEITPEVKNKLKLLRSRLIHPTETKIQEKPEVKEKEKKDKMGIFEALSIAIESNSPSKLIEYLFQEARNKRLSPVKIAKLKIQAVKYTESFY